MDINELLNKPANELELIDSLAKWVQPNFSQLREGHRICFLRLEKLENEKSQFVQAMWFSSWADRYDLWASSSPYMANISFGYSGPSKAHFMKCDGYFWNVEGEISRTYVRIFQK